MEKFDVGYMSGSTMIILDTKKIWLKFGQLPVKEEINYFGATV